MRILLIDDDRDDQALFCEAIERIAAQIELQLADNGERGIEILTSHMELPILVFLDINMPVMNGWDTLKVIRSNPMLKGCNVVIYSTSSQQADRARAQSFGAYFITKSNSFDKMVISLSEVIRQAIQGRDEVTVKNFNRELK